MKSKRNPMVLVAAMALLGGCGDDGGGSAPAPAPTAAPAEAAAAAPASARSADPGYEVKVIDHARDEVEFGIRRSLGGVEAMLEDAKANGWDTAELEQQKARLEKELQELLSS